MNFNFFDHRRVRQLLTVTLLIGAMLCMFPPRQPVFVWWAQQAFYIAVGYLLFGLLFLIIHKPRLMFVCMGCSAAISFYKNEAPYELRPSNTTTPNPLGAIYEPPFREMNCPILPEEADNSLS